MVVISNKHNGHMVAINNKRNGHMGVINNNLLLPEYFFRNWNAASLYSSHVAFSPNAS